MPKIVELAPAKVNIYLKVLGKRPDGYHDIETLFEKIDITDKITLTLKKSGIVIKSRSNEIPLNAENICYKAAKLMMGMYKVKKGVEISIEKSIPVAAGLGGGSSDAASVIRGLNKLWGLGLDEEKLMSIGAEIGSDVAFFCGDSVYALGLGRGEIIKPVKIRVKLWHLVITPPIKMLSGDIYKECSKTASFALTRKRALDTIHVPNKDIDNVGQLGTLLHNDLEDVVVSRDPIIKGIKNALLANGALNAIVSGSGSSVFGVFRNKRIALTAKNKCFKSLPITREWHASVARTYEKAKKGA